MDLYDITCNTGRTNHELNNLIQEANTVKFIQRQEYDGWVMRVVERRPVRRNGKRIMEEIPEDKRARGRPKKRLLAAR